MGLMQACGSGFALSTTKHSVSGSHFYCIYYPVFIVGKVGGGFLKMLFLSQKSSTPPCPGVASWRTSPLQISGKKREWGEQAGLPQRAPQAGSAGLSASEKEIKGRKEQSTCPAKQGS